LLESLRHDRQLFIDGKRVEDVTTDPRFAGAAQSLAELGDWIVGGGRRRPADDVATKII
jgi:aromatic ring hydroxylase